MTSLRSSLPMTSRHRMLAAIHHEPVDRVPVAPWGLGRLDPRGALAAELVARTDPWLEVGLGCDAVGGAAFPMEEKRTGPILARTIHAPGRDLHATWTTTAQTTACTEYPCKSIEDIEALLSIPYVRPHPDVARFLAECERIGEDALLVMGLGDGLCYPNDMLGTEYCSYLWATEPEIIRRMVATAAERVYAVVEEACRGGVDAFRIVGGEYATQLMGRRAWDELVVPYDAPLVELIHAHGGIAHYHNHGNMQRFLEDIAALKIDSLDPIEQPPYGDIQMSEALGADRRPRVPGGRPRRYGDPGDAPQAKRCCAWLSDPGECGPARLHARRHVLRYLWRGSRAQFHRAGGCGGQVREICTETRSGRRRCLPLVVEP